MVVLEAIIGRTLEQSLVEVLEEEVRLSKIIWTTSSFTLLQRNVRFWILPNCQNFFLGNCSCWKTETGTSRAGENSSTCLRKNNCTPSLLVEPIFVKRLQSVWEKQLLTESSHWTLKNVQPIENPRQNRPTVQNKPAFANWTYSLNSPIRIISPAHM